MSNMEIKNRKVNIIYQFLQQIIVAETTKVHQQLPTEFEISKKFNISRPTIHKALKIMEDEGFIYRKQGTGTFVKKKIKKDIQTKNFLSIGLLFPLIGKGEIFRPIAEEIVNLSEEYEFSLIWGGQFNMLSPNSQQMNQMLDFYIANDVSGIIMAPIEMTDMCLETNKKTIEKIRNLSIPTVLLDGDYLEFPERSDFDVIGIDNFRAGYQLANHFIEQGANRIDFCSYSNSAQTVSMRIRGYQQALIDAGIMPALDWIHYGDPENITFVKKIISKGGVNCLCSNDSFAFAFLKQILEIGYQVPKDIRIAGVDALEFSQYTSVSLTTVIQPCENISKVVIESLLSRMKNPLLPVRNIVLPTNIKIQKSSIIPLH